MSIDLQLKNADGIRGLACLIVLVVHSVGIFFESSFPYIAGSGKIGVWLFFVLSAFLLTLKFDKTRFSFLNLLNYGVGRILRIMPLFVISIFIYKIMGTAGIDSWEDLINAILFRKAYSHLWTIPVEFSFYFFLPIFAFLFIFFKKNFGNIMVVILFLGLLAIHQSYYPYGDTQPNTIEMIWYFPSFLCGIFLAVTIQDLSKYVNSLEEKKINLICFSVFLSFILITPFARYFIFSIPMDYSLANKFIYISLGWSVFILCSFSGKGWPGALVKSAFMKLLGKWSYSTYLLHWLVYKKLNFYFPESLLAMFAAFFIAIIFGGVIFKIIEEPIEKLRHGLLRSRIQNSDKMLNYSSK